MMSKTVKITLIIVGGVVTLGLAGLAVLSGEAIDFGEVVPMLGSAVTGAATGFIAGKSTK
ncbi:MAG: hypothetical protein ABFR47_09415 [Verrucomicrobiota bacterium]